MTFQCILHVIYGNLHLHTIIPQTIWNPVHTLYKTTLSLVVYCQVVVLCSEVVLFSEDALYNLLELPWRE